MVAMEIEYDNRAVEDLFNDFNLIKKKTDGVFAKQLKKKYDQLKAFETFSEFLNSNIGKPHSLSGDRKGCYGINISKNKRLIVKPISEDLSSSALKACKNIIIKGVEDYHGSKTTIYIP